MTSATVTDFSIQAPVSMGACGQNRNDNTANFADFMQSGTKAEDTVKTQPVKNSVQDAKAAYEKTENKAARDIARETGAAQQGSRPEEVQADGKAEEAEQDCLQKIAKELGVSQEDVEQALEILGLTVADLLQQGNMNLLIAQVTGVSPMEIVTDGDLFARMEMLVDQVSQELMQAAQELGMEFDEFVAVMEEALAQPTEPQVTGPQQAGDVQEMPENVAAIENGEMETPAALEELDEENVTVSDDGVTVEIDNRDAVPGERSQTDSFLQQDGKEQQKDEEAGFNAQGERAGLTPEFRGVQNLPQDVVQPEPTFERFDMEQTRRIIDQIADYVKIHQGQQVTELEMQLNPASLGTIHLQVASKAGTVSAQLIAQDQAVAAALESQLVQVKESLEAQGMKVDAVEVTVASHEFEQNLDRQGKQQEDEAKRTAGRSRRRILDLNELPAGDELPEEEMTEADRLQIEMMRMGGNRLNFQI